MKIDLTVLCLEQNKITASRFAKISAGEREITFKLEKQRDIVSKQTGEAKIFKEFLKRDTYNFEKEKPLKNAQDMKTQSSRL